MQKIFLWKQRPHKIHENLNPMKINTHTVAVKQDTGVQIIHCHGYHWVTAHKYASSVDVIRIYDSLYNAADDIVKTVVKNLFGSSVSVEMAKMKFLEL